MLICYIEFDILTLDLFNNFRILNNAHIQSSTLKNDQSTEGIPEELKDPKHGVVMGVLSDNCDNGKVILNQALLRLLY